MRAQRTVNLGCVLWYVASRVSVQLTLLYILWLPLALMLVLLVFICGCWGSGCVCVCVCARGRQYWSYSPTLCLGGGRWWLLRCLPAALVKPWRIHTGPDGRSHRGPVAMASAADWWLSGSGGADWKGKGEWHCGICPASTEEQRE